MNVLVTGGKGFLGTAFSMLNTDKNYILPSSKELDMSNPKKIKLFSELNKDIDIIVFNGYKTPIELFDTTDENQLEYRLFGEDGSIYNQFSEDLTEAFKIYINNIYLLSLYKESVKAVFFLTTGTEIDYYKESIYRSSKNFGWNFLKRNSFNPEFKHIPTYCIHPGHMGTEENYIKSSRNLDALIRQYFRLENRGHYIFDTDTPSHSKLITVEETSTPFLTQYTLPD